MSKEVWLPDNSDGLQNLCPQFHSAHQEPPSEKGMDPIMTGRLDKVIHWFYHNRTCCILKDGFIRGIEAPKPRHSVCESLLCVFLKKGHNALKVIVRKNNV